MSLFLVGNRVKGSIESRCREKAVKGYTEAFKRVYRKEESKPYYKGFLYIVFERNSDTQMFWLLFDQYTWTYFVSVSNG